MKPLRPGVRQMPSVWPPRKQSSARLRRRKLNVTALKPRSWPLSGPKRSGRKMLSMSRAFVPILRPPSPASFPLIKPAP